MHVPTLALALALAWSAPQATRQRVTGAFLEYAPDAVVHAGRRVPWETVGALEERDPSAADLDAELQRRRARAGRSPAALVELGSWCRAQELEEEAHALFRAALEVRAGYAPARRALGELQVDGEWRAAAEMLSGDGLDLGAPPERLLELADACRTHGLRAEEWRCLAAILVDDGFHADACARIAERVRWRPAAAYAPPVAGRWRAVVDRTRHHQRRAWALFALDLVAVDERGRAYRGDGARNSDHLAFGAPVYAIADGVVAEVTNDAPDMNPGQAGEFGTANTVSVEHAGGEYADYFHLQQGSVTVRTGEAVVRGQLLGRVGNSGASGSPHLHFEITIPLHGPDGKSEWLGVPFRWTDFSLVDVEGRACEIAVASARPQEGWTMVLPEPPP
jgi:hypothetical protein